jgi:hypothetical protein
MDRGVGAGNVVLGRLGAIVAIDAGGCGPEAAERVVEVGGLYAGFCELAPPGVVTAGFGVGVCVVWGPLGAVVT